MQKSPEIQANATLVDATLANANRGQSAAVQVNLVAPEAAPAKIVSFADLECPRCGSTRVRTQRTKVVLGRKLRQTKCLDCCWPFQVIVKK